MYMNVCLHMSVDHACAQYPKKPEEGIWAPGTGATVWYLGIEPPSNLSFRNKGEKPSKVVQSKYFVITFPASKKYALIFIHFLCYNLTFPRPSPFSYSFASLVV